MHLWVTGIFLLVLPFAVLLLFPNVVSIEVPQARREDSVQEDERFQQPLMLFGPGCAVRDFDVCSFQPDLAFLLFGKLPPIQGSPGFVVNALLVLE